MSQLLALSFDCISTPYILLKNSPRSNQTNVKKYGRGFAWYNGNELSVTNVKETQYRSNDESTLINTMQDHDKFNSSIFIGHIRSASKRLIQKDTQPFTQSYAGRDWIFVHSGDLNENYEAAIPLQKNAPFEPIGSTDSEHIFCYLLAKIKQAKARSLADIGWSKLHKWLIKINRLGTANFIISDGLDMVVYHDMNSFNPLYYLRSHPPHDHIHFDSPLFTFDMVAPFDITHTFVLVSNQNCEGKCFSMDAAQMLVLRRGQITWSNLRKNKTNQAHANQIDRRKKIPLTSMPNPGPAQSSIIDFVSNSERRYYSITHETNYHYKNAIHVSKHQFLLHPVCDHIQNVLDYKLSISVPGYGEFFEDVFNNIAVFYEINTPYRHLNIKSESVVALVKNPTFESEILHQSRDIPLVWMPWQRQMISPYLLPPELPESQLNALIEFAMSFVKRNNYDLMEVLNDINQTIYRDFEYVQDSTSLRTTPYEFYYTRKGVCQDFTNLFICLARLINVPARYRMGYIYTEKDYDNQIQGDASHAWVELYLPFIGWYGFDPTNGCIAEKNHVRIACGRNYTDASPTSGTIYQTAGGKKSSETLDTSVQVRLLEHYEIKNFA
jgi:transglutaminase-like putative cysteine protease/predicted glutamine amidotransferase